MLSVHCSLNFLLTNTNIAKKPRVEDNSQTIIIIAESESPATNITINPTTSSVAEDNSFADTVPATVIVLPTSNIPTSTEASNNATIVDDTNMDIDPPATDKYVDKQ